jgi:hypothetical protein
LIQRQLDVSVCLSEDSFGCVVDLIGPVTIGASNPHNGIFVNENSIRKVPVESPEPWVWINYGCVVTRVASDLI